jgi:ferredoxin
MAVQITPSCITCGACVWECPTEAIAAGDPRPVIDPDACTECYGFFGESQCMIVCPVDAIASNPDERVDDLAARFRRMYPGEPMHDTSIWRRLPRCGPMRFH